MPRNAPHEPLAERVGFPWWIAVVAAAVIYIVFRWIFPSVAGSSGFLQPVAARAHASAGFLALLSLALAAVSLFLAYRRRRLLDVEISLATIRALPHHRLRHFVAESFRNQGYTVADCADEHGSEADLMLACDGERRFVQCRRWRSQVIDVEPVRRLYALVESGRAAGCIFVTTGRYDREAVRFAAGKPIRLVSGRELDSMLRSVRSPR